MSDMVTERDDGFEPWPVEARPDRRLTLAIGELCAVVFEMFPSSGSIEHRTAMTAVLDLHEKLRASHRRRTLN